MGLNAYVTIYGILGVDEAKACFYGFLLSLTARDETPVFLFTAMYQRSGFLVHNAFAFVFVL